MKIKQSNHSLFIFEENKKIKKIDSLFAIKRYVKAKKHFVEEYFL